MRKSLSWPRQLQAANGSVIIFPCSRQTAQHRKSRFWFFKALWRNVIFSIKNFEKSEPGFTMLRGLSAARKNYGAPVEKLCWSCLSPTLNLVHPPCPYVSSCSDQVWRSCWENCWCCLSPVDAEPVSSVFSCLFFFLFLSFFVPSKPVTFLFGFFRSFPFPVQLGTLPSSIPSFLYFYLLTPTVLSFDLTIPSTKTLHYIHRVFFFSISTAWSNLCAYTDQIHWRRSNRPRL